MSKIAMITDTHFGARNDSTHFLDFYEKFYRDVFFPRLESEKIDTVFILGDTFDRRKYVNFYTLKRAKEMFFDKLADRNITVYMLVGNHDVFYKNTNDVNSISLMLSEYKNINVISEPITIDVGGIYYCMIPWICDENRKETFDEIKNTSAKICMGHFEIDGFAMYRGLPANEGLSRKIFNKFDLVFSGHYHHRSHNDNIYYLGNPYELTWSDYDDQRGFHIFDFDKGGVEFIPNPHIMFHRIQYDDKVESITEISNKDLTKYANSYVKVVVINKVNPYMFDKFMSALYNVNPIDVTIAEDYTEYAEGVEEDMVNESEDVITIMNKYVDTMDGLDIDTSRFKSVLQELYVEALNQEQA